MLNYVLYLMLNYTLEIKCGILCINKRIYFLQVCLTDQLNISKYDEFIGKYWLKLKNILFRYRMYVFNLLGVRWNDYIF